MPRTSEEYFDTYIENDRYDDEVLDYIFSQEEIQQIENQINQQDQQINEAKQAFEEKLEEMQKQDQPPTFYAMKEQMYERYLKEESERLGIDKDSNEYFNLQIRAGIEIDEYFQQVIQELPDEIEFDIIGTMAQLTNIGRCSFESQQRKMKMFETYEIENKDQFCLIHALKDQVERMFAKTQEQKENKQTRIELLNDFIEEYKDKEYILNYETERSIMTKLSEDLMVNIEVFDIFNIKFKQQNQMKKIENYNAVVVNKKHYFNSKNKELNDQCITDYFQLSTVYCAREKPYKNTLKLYKYCHQNDEYGVQSHYDSLISVNLSHCFFFDQNKIVAYKVSKTKQNEYTHKLEEQIKLYINLKEEQEVKQLLDLALYSKQVQIGHTFNQKEYCEQVKKQIIEYKQKFNLSNPDGNDYVASFDFETIIRDGSAKPYSFSFVIIERNLEREELDNYLQFFEINHYPNDVNKQNEFEQKILIILQSLYTFANINFMLTYSFNGKKFDHVLLLNIIHKFNMKKYLYETELTKNGKKYNHEGAVKIVNGGIQKMVFQGVIKILDIKQILGIGTLFKQCQNFNIKTQKLRFNHFEVQDYYDENGDLLFKPLLSNDIKEYNNVDCIAVIQIQIKLEQNIIQTILNAQQNNLIDQKQCDNFIKQLKYGKYYTTGQISLAAQEASQQHGMKTESGQDYKQVKFTTDKDKQTSEQILNYHEDYQFIRAACVGGRTQAFQKGIFETQITGQDFVSLYPSVQLDPNNFYPCGEVQKFNTEKDCKKQYKKQVLEQGKQAIVEIFLIEQTSTHCVFPIRDETLHRLDWSNHNPNKNIIVTSVELNKAIELGYKFKFVKCMIWQDKIKGNELFRIIKMFFEKKQEQDLFKIEDDKNKDNKEYKRKGNEAMRTIMKILCNSLYGKMMQKVHLTRESYVDSYKVQNDKNVKDIKRIGQYESNGFCVQKEYLSQKQIQKQLKSVHLAAFVYSYARIKLFNCFLDEKLAQQGFKPLYCDTDSCFYKYEDYETVKQHIDKINDKIIYRGVEPVAQLGQLTQEVSQSGNNFEDGKHFVESKAIIIAPKFYTFLKRNITEKDKCVYYKKGAKGMHYQTDIILTNEIKEQLKQFIIDQKKEYPDRKIFEVKNVILKGKWQDEKNEKEMLQQWENHQIKILCEHAEFVQKNINNKQLKNQFSLNILSQRLITSIVQQDNITLQRKFEGCSINNVVMVKKIKFDV